MEPYISFGGWLLVVAVALIFAGLHFNTRNEFKQEQKDRAELKDAFTKLQEQYQEVCLHRDRLAANARQIAQDRDKAYDKVEELKTELQYAENQKKDFYHLLEATNKQLDAIRIQIVQFGYEWDDTIPTSENIAAYFDALKAQSALKRRHAIKDLEKAMGMADQLVAAAREIKPRGAISKATYERLQAALANFTKGGAA
jgi:chromosome segregation ATPase